MSYHRFIGGSHDGEWRNVHRQEGLFLPAVWTLADTPLVELNLSAALVEPAPSRRTDYVPLPLHVGKDEIITIFIERGMKPEDALLQLVERYRPVEGKSDEVGK